MCILSSVIYYIIDIKIAIYSKNENFKFWIIDSLIFFKFLPNLRFV